MRRVNYSGPQTGPRNVFAQVGALIVGLGVLVISVILGAFFLAAFFGFVLLVAITVYARFWWLRRKFAKAQQDEFIETEYEVIDRSDTDRRRH